MVGDAGHSNRTKKDGVSGTQLFDPLGRHHRAVLEVPLRTPVVVTPLDFKLAHRRHAIDARDGGRDYLLTDPIPSYDIDDVPSGHEASLL